MCLSNSTRLKKLTIICIALAIGLNCMTAATAAERKPNVIVIMCDDLGHEGFSSYGSLTYKTPHLDKLAAGGMRFRHCYSQPICTPSRVQIMTGRYNFRNYVRFGYLDPTQKTFGNVLRDAGYATTIAGKWQLTGDTQTVKDFGFDSHCLWQIGGRASRYWEPRIVENGKVRKNTDDRFGPDVCNDFLVDFIRTNRKRPFFAYYPMMLPHWPFVPTPDTPEDKGSRQRLGKYDGKKGGEEYFPDMVAYVDKLVGRLVKTLDDEGLRENTLILFTCDNGCATNIVSKMPGRIVNGGKGSMPDAGTHVALIASWKGTVPAGKVSDALVDFSDFLPTVAEVSGGKPPTDRILDGRSFLPHLLGKAGTAREWIFCHYIRGGAPAEPKQAAKRKKVLATQAKSKQNKTMGRYARTQKYKLYDDGRLFDVASDVLETRVIQSGRGSKAAESARSRLQSVHDSMPAWQPFRSGKPTRKRK
jgi:arylsulfatase A